MKIYKGERLHSGVKVTVQTETGEYSLKHHVRHSPTGFEWGYGGSGPAELARWCILLDH